jgi:phosphoglycerate dehydrogenase-like enzyme
VVPESAPDWVTDAVRAGGGTLAPMAEAEAIVWFGRHDPDDVACALAGAPRARWIHLLSAGVDRLAGVFEHDHIWTCGKGLSAGPLAEHAMLLALAGLRGLPRYLRAGSWQKPGGISLYGRPVTIVGGGGVTSELLRHLAVYGCEVTVVRRRAQPLAGAARVLTADRLQKALPGAQVVFLALSLTPETEGIIGARELELMDETAWLINVARGRHVVTDDLVDALRRGAIGGAALDVTDPEPLPEGHPLWGLPNCVITPHTATTIRMIRPALAGRLRDNVARFAAGEPLLGEIDVDAGY